MNWLMQKHKLKWIGMLVGLLILHSCQGISSAFGKYDLNGHQEVALGTLGHEEHGLFSNPKYVSYTNVLGDKSLVITIKADSIKINSKQANSFFNDTTKTRFLTTHKKAVYIISILDKQDLIARMNTSVNLDAIREMKVVTELVVRRDALPQTIDQAESSFIRYNPREKAYQISFFKNGQEQLTSLNSNAIIGYKSMFLCCELERTKLKVKNLSESKCKGSTYKTQRVKTKTENYERL